MSQNFDLQYVLDYLEESYFSIPSPYYDECVFFGPLSTVLDSNKTEEEHKQALIDLFKLFSTNDGTNLLRSSRCVAKTMIHKARELMENIDRNGSNLDTILAREISNFSIINEDIFVEHSISYTIYGFSDLSVMFIDDDDVEEEDEEWGDEEEDEEWEEEDQEYADTSIQHGFDLWEERMKFIHEQIRRRNDPFYVAVVNCVKMVQKKINDERMNENTRQLRLLKNILRREMETGTEIVSGNEFSCAYELAEQYTGVKVVDELSIKFGCRFSVTYNNKNCSTTVTIFNGVETHEFDIIANIPLIIQLLKNEIRKDTAQ